MSAINNALSELAKEKSKLTVEISKAEVKAVKQKSVLPWVVGSFTLSLAVGGWALSQQSPSQPAFETVVPVASSTKVDSPTTKTLVAEQPVYQTVAEETLVAAPKTAVPKTEQKVAPQLQPKPPAKPVSIAKVTTQPAETSKPIVNQGEVVIEQVELTPVQLSLNAQERAQKALDNNNLSKALEYYAESLRYTPNNKQVRKRLAALHYGKGEVRKAADILQRGIALDSNDTELRLSLAKMLMKEQQDSVALTVLSPLPQSSSVEYLSLRAALAQKQRQQQLALQSYQQLVEREPESGRWWMGLGITQEREFQLAEAKSSYQQALNKLGLSGQSQQFIRDRIALIESLEEQPSEN